MITSPRRPARSTSLAVIWASYLWTIVVAVSIGWLLPIESPLTKAAVVDLIATVMIFAISAIFDNSSVYDPYWSVAPVVIVGYWTWVSSGGPVVDWRAATVLLLVAIWGARLTWNFLSRWQGLEHEDWRYAAYRTKGKARYWMVSFFGFHLTPTIVVFAACVPAWYACSGGGAVGGIDALAVAVTTAAILIEAVADAEMRAATAAAGDTRSTFRGGLWAISRHPNYFGEILFWWGLFLFAVAADPANWWTVFGPVGVTVLFLGISLPLIEARMCQRRGDYGRVRAEISMLVPWFPKRR